LNNLQLPEAWLDTMSRVRSVMPSAYLAGGALRDLDNGRPVKDLDVFVTEDMHNDRLERALGGSYSYFRWCPGDYIDAAKEVQTTYTFKSLNGQPDLNFVQLDPSFNTASIIDRMDFGLCQIGFDPLGVVTTEAYDFDKRNGVFTLTRAESVEAVMRSIKRWKRLSAKYPGWDIGWKAEDDAMAQAAWDRLDGTAADDVIFAG
jgi:hypothetical protein